MQLPHFSFETTKIKFTQNAKGPISSYQISSLSDLGYCRKMEVQHARGPAVFVDIKIILIFRWLFTNKNDNEIDGL